METIKFRAKGVLLRHFESMGTDATEPFRTVLTDSKEALLDHVNTLMVDNIKACGMIITTVHKTEDEDEMFIDKEKHFECVGNLTEKECENLRKICLDIK